MRILYITENGLASDLARQMKDAGHEVKFFIKDVRLRNIFDGIVEKTNDWEKELDWVGRNIRGTRGKKGQKGGLIVFDDNGFGRDQESLRKMGYSVFGGNVAADKLEYDREFCSKTFKKYKINSNSIRTFTGLREAVNFIEKNPRAYTIKREGANSKFVTFVGEHPRGKDVIEMLENYYKDPLLRTQPISLQQKADGIEIGVGRYFNGRNWVGPIEINVEHPHMFPGNIGPFTEEMGTVAWLTDKENRIYRETLKKITPFLQKINYKGDMAINMIVDGPTADNIYALEMTPRLGSPIIHLHTTLHKTDWAKFMKAIADGENINLQWRRGYGVVISLSVPPFPFQKYFQTDVCSGLTIDMDKLTPEDWEHVHFDEVMFDAQTGKYKVSSQTDGFVMYVTGFDKKSIARAKNRALAIARKIHLPKMFYRIDIGDKFARIDKKRLEKWGWI